MVSGMTRTRYNFLQEPTNYLKQNGRCRQGTAVLLFWTAYEIYQTFSHAFTQIWSGLWRRPGIGNLVTVLIFNRVTLENVAPGNDAARLAAGVILAFFISGFGGAIAGFLGGLNLPVVDLLREKRAYAWKSALVLGLIYGFLLFPLVLVLALFSFYNIGNITVWLFSALFAIVGAVIGLLYGLLFGSWTLGLRRAWRVMAYAALGFGVGGGGLGWGVYHFIYSFSFGQYSWNGRFAILLGLFILGLAGGAALGLVYGRYAAQPHVDKPLFAWLTRPWRWAIGIGMAALFLVLIVRPVVSLVRSSLQPQDANLSTVLTSQTVGTHWLEPVDLSGAFNLEPARDAQIAVADGGQIGLVWSADGRVMYLPGTWDAAAKTAVWQEPVLVSTGEGLAETPQITSRQPGSGASGLGGSGCDFLQQL
jgi:hypothetical protein